MPPRIHILDEPAILRILDDINVPNALRRTFGALATGQTLQPNQQVTLFPDEAGDVITYSGVLADQQAFGVKMSPYLSRPHGALITAWTLLMSMETGAPLLLCDASRLTVERTAGTTALAVDLLARPDARVLAVVGLGKEGQAHLRHVLPLRAWQSVRLYSPTPNDNRRQRLTELDRRISWHDNLLATVAGADVIMLCTSSGAPVLDPAILTRRALITSISTNAPRAHEIPPEALSSLDVYCDYRNAAPVSAGEMQIAVESHQWSPSRIRGDLPELITKQAPLPDYMRHVYFRSIGLGIEDVAIALELYRAATKASGTPLTKETKGESQ